MTEELPPWVIKRNGSYLGAFGWVGTHRQSAVSFQSEHDAGTWSRQNPIARGAEIVNDPYIPPPPEMGPAHVSDFEPVT